MKAATIFRPVKAAYTIPEAAVFLNVSVRTVKNLLKRKLLRRSKIITKVLIPGEDVETLIERSC